MTEWSFPFADQSPDSEDGRPITDAETRQWHRAIYLADTPATRFLVPRAGNELAVTNPAGVTIRINTGAACVDGFGYVNDASKDLTAVAADPGQTRRDRVVLRADWALFKCRAAIKQGTPATVPALTQTRGTTWEVALYYYDIDDAGAITNLTSEITDDCKLKMGTLVAGDMLDDDVADGSTLEVSGGHVQIKDQGVSTAKLADDGVTAAKLAHNLDGTGIGLNADQVDGVHAADFARALVAETAERTTILACNSLTMVDVTDMSVDITLTAPSTVLIFITGTGYLSNNGITYTLAVYHDDGGETTELSPVLAIGGPGAGANTTWGLSFTAYQAAVAAGLHTFKLKHMVSSGQANFQRGRIIALAIA